MLSFYSVDIGLILSLSLALDLQDWPLVTRMKVRIMIIMINLYLQLNARVANWAEWNEYYTAL